MWSHTRLSEPGPNAHDDHPREVFSGPAAFANTTTASEEADFEADYRAPGLADYIAHLRVTARLHGDVESWVNFRVSGPHIPIGEFGIETQP